MKKRLVWLGVRAMVLGALVCVALLLGEVLSYRSIRADEGAQARTKFPFPLLRERVYRHEELKFEKPFELSFELQVRPEAVVRSHLVYAEANDQTITIGGVGDLARKLGFDGPGREMHINTERFPNAFRGRYLFDDGDRKRVASFWGNSLCYFVAELLPRPSETAKPPPPPEELQKQAEQFLKSRDLFPAGAYFSDIRYSERSELKQGVETTQKLFSIVTFRQRVDGRETLNSKIELDSLNDGRIRAVFFFMREWRPLAEFPIVSPAEAVKRIQMGLGQLRTETIRMEARGIIDECTIALATRDGLAKPNGVFLQPVYVIQGWQDLPAKPRFEFIVPALADDFLEPVSNVEGAAQPAIGP